MTGKPVVLESIETPDGGRCVDIFKRPDGSFGFEEYRRDVEDARGWFPVAVYSRQSFASAGAARDAALASVSWLGDAMNGD